MTMVVLALAMGIGCGSGGGGGENDDDATPDPARTATAEPTATAASTSTPAAATPVLPTPLGATPVTTATPVATTTPTTGSTVSVAFTLTTNTALSAFQLTATYPNGKGSFRGSAASVLCITGSVDIFIKNDQDDGHLILSVANRSALTFPRVISCTFDVSGGEALTAADFGIAADKEVVDENGAIGDPATLTVDVELF